jgi:electron transfer flavoprotein alpha subunit
VLAVIPVRDGILPAGGAEAACECYGRAVLIGSGTVAAAASIAGELRCIEAGAFSPGAWAHALDPILTAEPIVVLPSSADGRDLAPRLAAVLDRPLFAGAIKVTEREVVVARDGGLTMHTVVAPERFVATLQVGVRGVDPVTSEATAATSVELLTSETMPTQDAAGADAGVVEVLGPDVASIDLAEATRIVAGGAGLDGSGRFDQLAKLGELLGASVGATRVITDRGWIGHERQIGTTGVVVDPRLYLAFGISGAVQHTSGLGDPEHIISINLDAHCPMMQLADLAVVADANELLDELIDLLATPAITRITMVDPDG